VKYGIPSLNRFLTTLYQISKSAVIVARVPKDTRYDKTYIAAKDDGRRAAPQQDSHLPPMKPTPLNPARD
jgi:hypothetical protein